MKKNLCLIMACLCLVLATPSQVAAATSQDNTLYAESQTSHAGETFTLSVKMKNSVSVCGFQFDLALPSGLSVATDNEGDALIALSLERTTAKKTNYFDCVKQKDGSYRVMASSTKLYTFSGNDGEVATVTINVAKTMAQGNYTIMLQNIILSDTQSKTYKTAQTTIPFSVTGYPVTGITLTPASATCQVGETVQLTATVQPASASNKAVNWSSSKNAVATVSSTGLVTAVVEGTTNITVTSVDGGYTATCAVEVKPKKHVHKYVNGICECGLCDPDWKTADANGFYLLSNTQDMLWFAGMVNANGVTSINGRLACDIDFTNVAWSPIGTQELRYVGTFDGQGHRICRLSINSKSATFQGFFGVLSGGCILRNLIIDSSCSVYGWAYCAGLAGGSYGSGVITIENCGNEANVTCSRTTQTNAAGLFGCCYDSGTTLKMTNCYNTGTITGETENGAITAWMGNDGVMTNCWNSGAVKQTSTGEWQGGAFARYQGNAVFANCFSITGMDQKGITSFSSDQLASGELCYLLNEGNIENPVWRQTIGKDPHPVLDASHEIVWKRGDKFVNSRNDVIYYTATSEVVPYDWDVFGANIVDTEFKKGQGSITFDGEVKSIGNQAFFGCNTLTSITIPKSVTSIGDNAFNSCTALASLTIPSGVVSLGYQSFYGCTSLTAITIPASVTYIGNGAFACCHFSSIQVESGNTCYDSRNGCNAIIETARDKLIKGCNHTIIPEDVRSIDTQAFLQCNEITSIAIPEGVTTISSHAFEECANLTSIILPPGLKSIEDDTFSGCSSLSSASIPTGVESIGARAFWRCSSLSSIVVPAGVMSLGYCAFADCINLRTITLQSGLKEIGIWAFRGCTSLATISLPMGVTSLRQQAFEDCTALTTIELPKSLKTIEFDAFRNCTALTSVLIPTGVTTIGKCAFYYCTSLQSVTLPETLRELGYEAFLGCKGLKEVRCHAKKCPTLGYNGWCYLNHLSTITFYIPYASQKVYRSDADWGQLKLAYLPEDVTLDMAKGWNWVSHDMADNIPLSAIANGMDYIVGQKEEAVNDPILGMVGSITSLDPTLTYKTKMNAAQEFTTTGQVFDCLNTDITVTPGWNWLGYPVCKDQSPDEALVNFPAADGDVLVGQDGISIFDATAGKWTGTLQTLETGKGYLLKSSHASTFRYDISEDAALRAPQRRTGEAADDCLWVADKHAYPNVMSVMACLKEGEEVIDAEHYIVGAFCGNECRGVGQAVNGIVYITVYGQGDEMISFRLLDTQGEVLDAIETEPFRADVLGSHRHPYALTVHDATGVALQNDNVMNVEYYSPDGMRLSAPRQGVNIVRRTMPDGSVSNQKMYAR